MKNLTILTLAIAALMVGCGKQKANNPVPMSTQINDIWVSDSEGTFIFFDKNGTASGYTTTAKYVLLSSEQVKIGEQIYDIAINGDKLTLAVSVPTPGGIRKATRVYSRMNSEAMKQADKARKPSKSILGAKTPKSDIVLENAKKTSGK
jgi:hypothetical protein